MTSIHTHSTDEAGLLVNSYLVETGTAVVAIDGTLTVSDSQALFGRIDALGKPLAGVLITHAHPDHVAGVTTLVEGREVPVVALKSVERLMRSTEAAKHAQWSAMFGDEWIPRWVYPNRLVADDDVVTFDGVGFRVHDLGPGGDSDANAVWTLEDGSAAFVGDVVFNGTHSYIADGGVLRWLANIGRLRALLDGVRTLYPGHGPSGTVELLDQQERYLIAYCTAVLEIYGDGVNLEAAEAELTRRMREVRPDAPLEFMIGLSAGAVTEELGVAQLPDEAA